tara:strand:- start:9155 stop:9625 length:471 start_codon:yes stop_codon:yes gene_type:complete
MDGPEGRFITLLAEIKEIMTVDYKINALINTDQFIELLKNSTLGERRPIQDRKCMDGMISNSNLIVSAWDSGQLIGIARSITDFHYACYLSDLAVSENYQKSGIGKQLQIITQKQLGPECKLILIAAPAANKYYQHIGFTNNPRCWILERGACINS